MAACWKYVAEMQKASKVTHRLRMQVPGVPVERKFLGAGIGDDGKRHIGDGERRSGYGVWRIISAVAHRGMAFVRTINIQ